MDKIPGEIRERAIKTDELVSEITAASGEQPQGIAKVNNAVSQTDQVKPGKWSIRIPAKSRRFLPQE